VTRQTDRKATSRRGWQTIVQFHFTGRRILRKTAVAIYNSLCTDVAIKGASGYILPVTSNNY